MRAKNPICPRCNIREKEPGRAYCRECCREYNNELRERWKAKGLCPDCRRNHPEPGCVLCKDCRLKHAQEYRRRADARQQAAAKYRQLQKEAAGCREILAKMRSRKPATKGGEK